MLSVWKLFAIAHEPMRILATADLHGAIDVYKWLVATADSQHAEVLILAGDLFSPGSPEEQRAQGREIVSILSFGKIPCLYIMGNDDEVSLEHEDAQIKSLHGKRLSLGPFHFVGYEYTPPFFGFTFVKSEQDIGADLESLETLLDVWTILVTHAPAYGSLDIAFNGEHVGSRSLASLLARRPVLGHIHGHVHEAFGRDANHFNAASAAQRRAILIDLPSLDHQLLS
jgi:Icc-related predicted phosphoesterase